MEHSGLGAREEKRRFSLEHLIRWEASGLTLKKYCRQHNLKLYCFRYRRKEQRSRMADSATCLVEWPASNRDPPRLRSLRAESPHPGVDAAMMALLSIPVDSVRKSSE
jgi:hypothetical protein